MIRHTSARSGSMGLRQRWIAAALASALAVGSALPARADYVAQRGDVLEVTVSRAPALNRRVLVNGNGKITLPVLGEVEAADHSLSDLGREVRELLTAKNVTRSDVTISIAEYGPIYVDGSVAKPGEYRFRPEITVRNAIALAGGLDLFGGQARPTNVQLAEALGDYGSASIELARQKARVARLGAELRGDATFKIDDPPDSSVDTKAMAEILEIEERQLQASRRAEVRERSHLEQMLRAARDELTALEQAEAQQSSALDQQSGDASRSRNLLQKGVGTIARTEETQRTLDQARTQLIEVRVRLARARRDVQERSRDLEIFDDQRRARLLEGLRDATAEAAKAEYRLAAARQRMSGRSEMLLPGSGKISPQVTIRRFVKDATVRIAADLDTKLQSGDSLEVTMPTAASRAAGGPDNPSRPPTGHVDAEKPGQAEPPGNGGAKQ